MGEAAAGGPGATGDAAAVSSLSQGPGELRLRGMDTRSESPSPADLAVEAGGLIQGLGTLTIALFPFALPLLVLVIGPLAVLALAGLVLAIPILLPLWLGRLALRAVRDRRGRRPAPHHPGGPPPVKLPSPSEGDRPREVWLTPGRAAAPGTRKPPGQRR